ncbi:HlyC/CorC family transporter [Conservatibacter flavescens]|uniref:Magnesium/cobalt efflux protein n=1 Tax=Conservatibacter flavescens TaxID=28161 RepID=A0A2M8S264_9PAST|nr:HlyC/CorC family transporter [Conservatibacter flavescens]PJG85251.1 magnesium/cobalt efflux protein [Conservatibacter flavescens]
MDSIPLSTLFITLAILLILSAFFSSSETALLSVNRYRMRFLAEKGHRGARKAEYLLRHTDKLLSLILICNNLVNIIASALATIIGMRLYGDAGVAIATGALTFVMLICSEIYPKTVAAVYPEKIAFTASHILSLLMKLSTPIVFFMNMIIKGLMKLTGLQTESKAHSLSPEELRSIVNESGKFIPSAHQEMLLSILDLEEVTVDDIMVPRNDIGGIDIDDDWKSIMRQLNHAAHSRVVLYKGSMDENVVGMLRVREAYRLMLDKNDFTKETLVRAADEVYFIPESTSLTAQLVNFRNNKERIGLVVDEYGDIKGLVTLEDILEEIVGEFTTSTTPSIDQEVMPQSDGSVIIEGSANIRDINKLFDWHLSTEGPRTFNGLILEHLEEIPEEGTICQIDGLEIMILEVSDNMIKQAKVTKVQQILPNNDVI